MSLFVMLVTVRFGNAGAYFSHKYQRRFAEDKTGMPVKPTVKEEAK